MVDLVRLELAQRPADALGVLEIDLHEPDPLADGVEGLVALGIPEHGAENLMAMAEELFREVGPVLPADAGHERAPSHRAAP